jgi:hypothetical protein
MLFVLEIFVNFLTSNFFNPYFQVKEKLQICKFMVIWLDNNLFLYIKEASIK